MSVLVPEDWERIVFALRNFQHNPEFVETLKRVEAYLASGGHENNS